MSETSLPITPMRFADALQELPVESLHTTAAEIINSLSHLVSSNEQMLPFAAEGDSDCVEAIAENENVMSRMKDRIELLRAEVQRRGLPWPGDLDRSADRPDERNGEAQEAHTGTAAASAQIPHQNGSLSDEELRRQMEQRMQELQDGDDEDEGVHL